MKNKMFSTGKAMDVANKYLPKVWCMWFGHENLYIESSDPEIENICQRCGEPIPNYDEK